MTLAELDVLVVDDHEAMRSLLVRVLAKAGVTRLRVAADAADALDQVCARPATLILADQSMPGMSGVEFVACVREDPALAGTKVVMISGHVGGAFAEAARAAGADAVLVKPVSPRDLLQTINDLFAV